MTVSGPDQQKATLSPTISKEVTLKLDAIDRLHDPSEAEFTREYVYKRRPAIISGLMDSWPAMTRWNFGYFRTHFADLEVHANVQQLDSRLVLGQIGSFHPVKLADLMDRIESNADPRKAIYLRAFPVHRMIEHFPELADDYDLPGLVPNWDDIRSPVQWRKSRNPARLLGFYLSKVILNRGSGKPASRATVSSRVAAVMFIGSKGTVTPFHTDGMQTAAYLCQVTGRKRCYLVSPDQYKRLYPRPFRRQFGMAQVDYRQPDFASQQLFRDVVVEETVLNPGETLYIPNGYWHAIEAMDPAISYSHQIVNESNAIDWLLCIPERLVASLYFWFKGGLRNVTGAKDWDDWA